MSYIPPHLRNKTQESTPVNPSFSRTNESRSLHNSFTPQPSRTPSQLYRSETPTFYSAKRSSQQQRDRWSEYRDSRDDPKRAEKRAKWLSDTKEEREKMADATLNYDNLKIEVTGNNVPQKELETFYDIDMGEELDDNIFKAGFNHPMPVQKATIPVILARRDLMSCAQTGSGKTAAFLFPIISDILQNPPMPHQMSRHVTVFPSALILAPTRELGQQIHEEAVKFTQNTPIKSVCVHGGSETYPQIQEMGKGCDILVATPGRLLHFMERKIVCLSSVRFLIFDEADRMLDMGFEPQIRQICDDGEMPKVGVRQTLMFSATFPRPIQKLASDFLDDYVFITVGRVGSTVESIEQDILWVDERQKEEAVIDVLENFGKDKKGVIFVETKRGADMLENYLYDKGYMVDSIHGDRSQSDRDFSLARFKENKIQLLVATDVASRGLDIPDIEIVINYDMPNEIESYVHRVGRTGRAGKKGIAVTFINEKTQNLIPALVSLMEESKQSVPEWMNEKSSELNDRRGFGPRRSGRGSGYGGRRNGGGRFGGRDRRYEKKDDEYDVNRSVSTPIRPHFTY
ncbi:DEAD box ATP-dependent RNA helicase, putative [Entamoeba invadens IP1]|uniref:RNA helicase n=1 Tax=Entamoeba invadens IP1 TaxID=370355 RepID=A0A0A1U2R6_ENTIV|nr:DEAD box ATP-dependent RNA helicase, putative [Entamoeba invadens IP1]ELP88319.1 DEAD box ATP-dependent RNA helicase, putative [Entamoeba invadens IP1]|eukprot:XP_004255090.1 DEAD box ATP-dependent RNA helicase, putative [Entamoeba invadens IP1]